MTKWNIDQVHSNIGFKIKHLVVSTVRGEFKDFSGFVEAPDETFENATATFEAQTQSISTRNDNRDNHLRSPDFLDVEKYPQITFVSKSFTKKGDHFEIVGDLTMKNVTKEILLEAEFGGVVEIGDGAKITSFDITGEISRKEFGLEWDNLIQSGGAIVGDTVWFDIHVELKAE